MVKNLPAMPETQLRSLGREEPLEKDVASHRWAFDFVPCPVCSVRPSEPKPVSQVPKMYPQASLDFLGFCAHYICASKYSCFDSSSSFLKRIFLSLLVFYFMQHFLVVSRKDHQDI